MTVADAFHRLFTAVTVDRDAALFLDQWLVDDPTITMWGSDLGERASGADGIRALGESIASAEVTLRFHWDELQIHEHGEIAWVNAAGRIEVDGAPHPYRITAVLRRTFAGWRWHTFNGSIPD